MDIFMAKGSMPDPALIVDFLNSRFGPGVPVISVRTPEGGTCAVYKVRKKERGISVEYLIRGDLTPVLAFDELVKCCLRDLTIP